jgi:hypothetical protein
MVKLIKLVTGEEVVAKVDINDIEGTYILNKPIAFVQTEQGVAMVPLSPLVDGAITVRSSHIVYMADPIIDVVNAYNEKFGGLVMPSSKLMVN